MPALEVCPIPRTIQSRTNAHPKAAHFHPHALQVANRELGVSVNKTTRDNLSTAMHSEAFTHAKYMLFAERARRTSEAALAEIVRGDVDNLEDAIASESYGIESMYRDFAEQAFSVGDKAVGDRFEETRHDEINHRKAFKEALSELAKNQTRAW
jgi:rubrerythrin